jgi:hypothetical protein
MQFSPIAYYFNPFGPSIILNTMFSYAFIIIIIIIITLISETTFHTLEIISKSSGSLHAQSKLHYLIYSVNQNVSHMYSPIKRFNYPCLLRVPHLVQWLSAGLTPTNCRG